MATVYERDLIPRLSREVGDTDASNLYYTSNELFSALNDGIEEFNEEMSQQYEVVGSGDNAYYSPEPSDVDKRIIVLYSAKALLEGEMAKQSRTAIVHTNPTGRTDLSQRPEWTDKLLERISKKIQKLKMQREQRLVMDEMYDDDASMELKSDSGTLAEGLPITIIETMV